VSTRRRRSRAREENLRESAMFAFAPSSGRQARHLLTDAAPTPTRRRIEAA
jgi:hypothetical protein